MESSNVLETFKRSKFSQDELLVIRMLYKEGSKSYPMCLLFGQVLMASLSLVVIFSVTQPRAYENSVMANNRDRAGSDMGNKAIQTYLVLILYS